MCQCTDWQQVRYGKVSPHSSLAAAGALAQNLERLRDVPAAAANRVTRDSSTSSMSSVTRRASPWPDMSGQAAAGQQRARSPQRRAAATPAHRPSPAASVRRARTRPGVSGRASPAAWRVRRAEGRAWRSPSGRARCRTAPRRTMVARTAAAATDTTAMPVAASASPAHPATPRRSKAKPPEYRRDQHQQCLQRESGCDVGDRPVDRRIAAPQKGPSDECPDGGKEQHDPSAMVSPKRLHEGRDADRQRRDVQRPKRRIVNLEHAPVDARREQQEIFDSVRPPFAVRHRGHAPACVRASPHRATGRTRRPCSRGHDRRGSWRGWRR